MTSQSISLSEGFCQKLCDNPENENLLAAYPILQVLAISQAGHNNRTWVRLILSDGLNYMQAFLSYELHYMALEGGYFKQFDVIQPKFHWVPERGVFFVIELDKSVKTPPDGCLIGSPILVEPEFIVPSSQLDEISISPHSMSHHSRPLSATSPYFDIPNQNMSTHLPRSSTTHGPLAATMSNKPPQIGPSTTRVVSDRPESPHRRPTTAVANLNNWMKNWTIRVRVKNKYELKPFKSGRVGKWFRTLLVDGTGEIAAVCWQGEAMYERMQEGRIYYISKAEVNEVKKEDTKAKKYEITINEVTEIEDCTPHDESTVADNFTGIDELANMAKGEECDIIAIAVRVSGIETINLKSGSTASIRRLEVIDHSGAITTVKLWYDKAEQWSEQVPVVVLFRHVKVDDFGGHRTLSAFSSARMMVNPNIPEREWLLEWYTEYGSDIKNKLPLPAASLGKTSKKVAAMSAPVRTLASIGEEMQEVSNDTQIAFRALGVEVTWVYPEPRVMYASCPECLRKVRQEQTGGVWICDPCNREYPEPRYRYILSVRVKDLVSSIVMKCWDEAGHVLLGITANELERLKDDDDQFSRVLHGAIGKWNLACFAKKGINFNGSPSIEYEILHAGRPNFGELARRTRDELMPVAS